MATGRMLKRNISESRRLSQLKTDSARLLWTWIIPYLDSDGRFFASASMIKGKVVPRLLTFNERNIIKYINDMAEVGLIILYEVDGEKLLQYRKFNEFQKIVKDREARSLPSPDDGNILSTSSRPNPDKVDTKSEQLESNLIESNLIQSKLRESENPKPVDNSNDNSQKEAFFKNYKTIMKEFTENIQDAMYLRQITLFVESNLRSGNPDAITHCLESLLKQLKSGMKIKQPKAYLEAAFKIEEGKHNEAEAERISNEHKTAPINMSTMIGSIGKSIPGGH